MHYRELPTPALMIDLDVMERNLDRMAGLCKQHGIGLRPHTKTHKMVEAATMQMDRGAVGLAVAKVGEAEVMATAGAYEILVAHPILGDEKIRRLATLARSSTVIVAVDSEAIAQGLSRVAAASSVTLDVLVEFDAGYHRCGITPGADLARLAQAILKLPSLRFRGLMTYFGNVWGSEDERRLEAQKVTPLVHEARHTLEAQGIPLEIVSGGSTPAALMPQTFSGLTEVRPGSYLFNDLNTYHQGLCELSDCALRVVVSVVSTAIRNQAVTDAGSKTLSSDRLSSGPMSGFGYVVEHPEVQLGKLDEEHGYLSNVGEASLAVGDTLTLIPNHVCTCVNMHDEVFLVRQGEVVGSWRVAARGRVR